jgi:hypothetical protein
MAQAFEIIDPPELVGIEYQTIEYINGDRMSRPFAHFRWHDADHWILGYIYGQNGIRAGGAIIRLPRGQKKHKAALVVQPDNSPPTFTVHSPRVKFRTKGSTFVFIGFDQRLVVDMDFVREENARISAIPFSAYRNRNEKIAQPPHGHVV